MKTASEILPNPHVKVNFSLARSFQQERWTSCQTQIPALSSKNKDQFRDLHNYLNQKVITAINTLDSSTLGDNPITSHQVDYTVYVVSAHSS